MFLSGRYLSSRGMYEKTICSIYSFIRLPILYVYTRKSIFANRFMCCFFFLENTSCL